MNIQACQVAKGDNATTCSPVLTVHLPPIAATSDEAENVSVIFLPKIHHKIETILLKLKSSPSIPVHTLLGDDFDIDELLQVRDVIFECAKEKYCDEINDDAETTNETRKIPNTRSTCDFKLKSRRSTQTASDDIKELCLFIFGHRKSFPKSCKSSTSQHKSKQSKQLMLHLSQLQQLPNPPPPWGDHPEYHPRCHFTGSDGH